MFVIRRIKHDWSVAVFPSAGEILVLPSGKVLSPGDEVFGRKVWGWRLFLNGFFSSFPVRVTFSLDPP